MKPTVTLARKAREGSVTPDDPRVPVSMTVNGGVRSMTVEPRRTLLDALRDELGLTAMSTAAEFAPAWRSPRCRTASTSRRLKGWPHFEFGIVPGDWVNLLWPEVIGSIRGRYFILTGAQEQGGSHDQKCPLCRDWVRRNLLDSLGRRPFFGDGPFASRDIHDVSAL
jgi:hypothetical protein